MLPVEPPELPVDAPPELELEEDDDEPALLELVLLLPELVLEELDALAAELELPELEPDALAVEVEVPPVDDVEVEAAPLEVVAEVTVPPDDVELLPEPHAVSVHIAIRHQRPFMGDPLSPRNPLCSVIP